MASKDAIGPDSNDGEIRAAYNSGVRVSTLMRLTQRNYESIKGSLVRAGAQLRTGDRK
jgi:hypothetical protein